MLNKVISKIHQLEPEHSITSSNSDRDADSIIMEEIDVLAPNKDGDTFTSLLLPKYRTAFMVGLMLWLVQQLSGINLIIFYSNKVVIRFEKQQLITILLGGINWLCTLLAMILLCLYGRKRLMLNGLLMMCMSNSVIFLLYPEKIEQVEAKHGESGSQYYDVAFLFWIIIFIISFAITLGPISWLYLAEIMTELGMGISVAMNWLVVIIVSFLPSLARTVTNEKDKSITAQDLSFFFFAFSGWWMLGFFLVSLFLKETRGKNPKKIMQLYSNRAYNPFMGDSDSDNEES